MSGNVPTRYVQVWSNYDKSFVNKVHTLIHYAQDTTKNDVEYKIPCVFATPDRAFAQMRSQIARKRNIDIEVVKNIAIPLPIISLSRITQKLDLSRYIRHTFNKLYYNAKDDIYLGMVRPQPWDMSYQVDVWARNIQDLDDITAQIVLWLRADEMYLTVGHPLPMGERIVLTQLTDVADNSKLDSGEEKRTLRRTFTFVVHGWIVHGPREAHLVRKIITDVYDFTDEYDPVFLDQVVVTTGEARDSIMGKVTTSLYGVMVVGEAQAGQFYGAFQVPATALITGMQANILGKAPDGGNLRLMLSVGNIADSSRYVTIAEGDTSNATTFGSARRVMAGDVLSVYCDTVGSLEPGSWVEVQYTAELDIVV
jgi:hypothetical protein